MIDRKVTSDAAYFPPDYDQARAAFLELARVPSRPDSRLISFQVPSRRDSGLYVDYLELPALKTPETLLVLTSGVHGAEAFAGSAIQRMFLSELLESVPQDRVGILIAHVLNPFGFKYNRRSTENNVNLNRNFAFSEELFNSPNEAYDRLAALAEPTKPAGGAIDSLCEALRFVARSRLAGFSADELNRALALGQYKHPRGIEFGGKSWEPQIRHFIDTLARAMQGYKNLVIFDLHTGLGDRYELHLIPVDDPKSRDLELMQKLFSVAEEKHLYKLTESAAEGFYKTNGDINSLPPSLATAEQRTLTLTLEFGTLGNGVLSKIQTLARILSENRGFHLGYTNAAAERAMQASYKELFAPIETKWRTNVIERSREVLSRVLSRI